MESRSQKHLQSNQEIISIRQSCEQGSIQSKAAWTSPRQWAAWTTRFIEAASDWDTVNPPPWDKLTLGHMTFCFGDVREVLNMALWAHRWCFWSRSCVLTVEMDLVSGDHVALDPDQRLLNHRYRCILHPLHPLSGDLRHSTVCAGDGTRPVHQPRRNYVLEENLPLVWG